MRFLHTADLHLGKRLNDVSFLEDQQAILQQLVAMAVEERVDAVLIAGDIYQKTSPQSEAMTAFNDCVTALCERDIRVFAISGNHDSDQRISYFSALLKRAGVYVSQRFDGVLQQIPLKDDYGELTVHLLPFLRPTAVRRFYPEEKIESYQDAVCAVLRHSPIDRSARNVLLCHQFITGAELSDSEELAVGGLDNIDAAVFDDFDYVALGHIHKPQQAGRESCRYAGSPLKYSFSEARHVKSAVLVELKEKGTIDVRLLPFHAPHDMREVSGTLAEIMAMPYSEDYVRMTLRDELPPPDARVTISTVFPNMMKFAVENSRTMTDVDVLASESVEKKSVCELFIDFYRLLNNDALPTDAQLGVLKDVLGKLEDNRYEAD